MEVEAAEEVVEEVSPLRTCVGDPTRRVCADERQTVRREFQLVVVRALRVDRQRRAPRVGCRGAEGVLDLAAVLRPKVP